MKAGVFKVLANLWPPLFFAGIKATYLAADYKEARVTLKLRWYTRNYVGVQYGGSLMSMTDPWFMLMLMNNLGRNYFVWDKHAEIDYIAPGTTHVHAHFVINDEILADIREKTAGGEKYLPEFMVEIKDNHGNLVARVKRRVYIKLKRRARENKDPAMQP
ncbi:MAG TPA: DUF4442 domain-containing protein [Cellvibrio sp.]|nr:DUF4442 domain-containing protein [Cellvibrio sp.]